MGEPWILSEGACQKLERIIQIQRKIYICFQTEGEYFWHQEMILWNQKQARWMDEAHAHAHTLWVFVHVRRGKRHHGQAKGQTDKVVVGIGRTIPTVLMQ